MRASWPILVGGAALAPLVTWFPMLAHRFPWIGLPAYPPAPGVDLWSNQAFWFVALLLIGAIVGAQDRWLGMAVALAGLTVFWRGAALDPTHSVMFGLGALGLASARLVPLARRAAVKLVLVSLGAFQIAYLIQQHLGYDLFWGPLFGGQLPARLQPLGTFGSVDASAGYVAVLAPLMPLWLLPFAALVVYGSKSLGAVGALIVGLVFRFGRRSALYANGVLLIRLRVAVAIIALVLVGFFAVHLHKATQEARVGIWQYALTQWAKTDPVLGYGLGGWKQTIPMLQQRDSYLPTRELWAEAHNEPIQWLVETGLVGFALLLLWLWEHRRMVLDPTWGASIAALAGTTLTWHSFHVVGLALVGILLVGMATRQKEAACAGA